MVPVPFAGPRRLRSDADGNLWITAFPESAIYRYEFTGAALHALRAAGA